MRYALLIYGDEASRHGATPAEQEAVHQEYMELDRSIASAGQKLGGEALQPTATATTVQVRDGRTLTTDGPFAETREQLGGFYLIEAADLDEAIAVAARIPTARVGSIEVRPVWEVGG
jgi:hypothetical protein